MEALPVIGMVLSAGATAYGDIKSADAQGKANKIASDQLKSESDLVNQAKTQQANQNDQDQAAIATSAAASAMKKLTSKREGISGTLLTSPEGANEFTPGKTLLGGW